jgi:hypothetical protein
LKQDEWMKLLRFVGGLGLLFILYSLWMWQMTAQGLPDSYLNPVLALELVEKGSDIKQILGAEDGRAGEFIQKNTYKDFGYIALYAGSLSGWACCSRECSFRGRRFLGFAAAACAAIAAVLDLIEDRGMLKAIASEASDSRANSIRYSSLGKWAFLFVFSLLVGLIVMRLRGVFWLPMFCFLAAGLVGLAGVVLNLLRPKFYWTFPMATIGLGGGLIIPSFVLILRPDKLLSNTRLAVWTLPGRTAVIILTRKADARARASSRNQNSPTELSHDTNAALKPAHVIANGHCALINLLNRPRLA